MKNTVTSYHAACILIMLFTLLSCARNEEDTTPVNNQKPTIDIVGAWKLVDIVYANPPAVVVFDYYRCINNLPYAIADGVYYPLNGIVNQPDSLTDFCDQENWIFFHGDSLIISRYGFEEFECNCENNDVICRMIFGFPVIAIKGIWEVTDSTLIIETPDKGNGSFKICLADTDSLVVEYTDTRLILINTEK